MAALTQLQRQKRPHYLNPIAMLRHFWQHRFLIAQFTRRLIEGRYRGSYLGVFWSLAYPLFMLSIYTFVFGVVLKARWPQAKTDSLGEFALIIFCGLTAFNLFGEAVGKASTLITNVPNYVKKVVFPLEILVITEYLNSLFHSGVSLLVLFGAQLLLGYGIPWTAILLPVVALPAVLLALGVMWFLASIGVFVRDVGQLVALALQAFFFFTPIFYSLDIIPEPFRTLMMYNPLAPVVENFRRVLLWGEMPDWPLTIIWIVVTGIVMMLGYSWFMRSKKAFADVL